ncbi:MAG: (Fe-S)-binding protein [Planctomycetota bacterium]
MSAPEMGKPIRTASDLIQYQRTLDCVHCGLCLPACPTYELLSRESAGPRGRVYLMRGLAEGEVQPTQSAIRDLDLCLVCRACEPVCPSGVRFGEMMEFVRSEVLEPARPSTMGSKIRRLLLSEVVHRPLLLSTLARLVSFYQRSGLRRILRRYGVLKYVSEDLHQRDALMPEIPGGRERRRLPAVTQAVSTRRGRVALLEGCVAPLLLGGINRATVRVLANQGFEVVIPRKRTCCGALQAHFGALDRARSLARKTISAFTELGPVDAVLVNSAGCGAAMKEYGRLLEEGSGISEGEVQGAVNFGSKVKDVTEFLVEQGIRPPGSVRELTVAYADACHLAHAQGVRAAPREMLAAIPGVRLVALDRPDRCCGAGGLFNVLHPREAGMLLEQRIADLKRSGAKVLATANPGCNLQWRAGIQRAGLDVEVLHPVELLDRATGPR